MFIDTTSTTTATTTTKTFNFNPALLQYCKLKTKMIGVLATLNNRDVGQ